ncbi:hypothetical protein Tco_1198010 [Tanacetum coccineum]
MPSIWWIERLCYRKFAFIVLLSHVGWNFVTPTQLDYIMGNTPYGHIKVYNKVILLDLFFALVLHPLICKIKDSFSLSLHAWYLDDGTIIGDTLVVGKVLELIMEDGPRRGLHLNVNKTKVFWPKEDPRSRLVGAFPYTIPRPLHGVKLLGGLVSVDFDFSSELVFKRVAKSIELMDVSALLPLLDLDLVIASGGLPPYPFLTGGSVSTLQMALWKSQMEDHSSDWLRVVPISRLGQTMNGRTYWCVLCYRLDVPLFSVLKPCSACSRVFMGVIFGDHAVLYAGMVGIKHRHNVVCDTLVDICYQSGILAGKEVDIGLGGGRDKSLRPANMLLYSWDGGLDVCVVMCNCIENLSTLT